MRAQLLRIGACSPEQLEDLAEVYQHELEEAVEFARRSPFPDAREMQTHVYATKDIEQHGLREAA
jgi:TPP-dependent pyruvate/acetoin dehydrogenase alpha subunit